MVSPRTSTRRDVGGVVGGLLVLPEQPAVVRGDADECVPQPIDVHSDAADFGRHRRAVARAAAVGDLGLPDRLAGLFVERDQGGVVPARRHDQFVAIDQRRLAVAPARHHLVRRNRSSGFSSRPTSRSPRRGKRDRPRRRRRRADRHRRSACRANLRCNPPCLSARWCGSRLLLRGFVDAPDDFVAAAIAHA